MVSKRSNKRNFNRVYNGLNHTVTNSVTDKVLYTAEDPVTLVRALINLHYGDYSGTANTDVKAEMTIEHQPQGQSITTPQTAQVLDEDMPISTIVRKKVRWGVDVTNGARLTRSVEIDLKSKRKLKPGDTLNYKDICSLASGGNVTGDITLIFME